MKIKVNVQIGPKVEAIIIFEINCKWWKINPLGIRSKTKKCEYQKEIALICNQTGDLLKKYEEIDTALRKCFCSEDQEKIETIWVGIKYK